jgi:hypothetical protein
MNNDNAEQVENRKRSASKMKPKRNLLITIIVVLWVTLGITGLITSIVCFAYNGTYIENWLGLVVAATLSGPFYWLYFAFAPKTYCSSSAKDSISLSNISKAATSAASKAKTSLSSLFASSPTPKKSKTPSKSKTPPKSKTPSKTPSKSK